LNLKKFPSLKQIYLANLEHENIESPFIDFDQTLIDSDPDDKYKNLV